MNLSLQKTGSKVNGLVEPLYHRRVYCLLFIIPDGLGSDRKTGWLWGRIPMVPFQTKGRKFLPWTDQTQVVNFSLFQTWWRERWAIFNLILKKEIFQYTGPLKGPTRLKNQWIIGSGLLNWFRFIQSVKKWSWTSKLIRRFSAPHTGNGLLQKMSMPSSHFMKQDSSGNFNGSESSTTKWTRSQLMDSSNLITFWTWRREPKISISLLTNENLLSYLMIDHRPPKGGGAPFHTRWCLIGGRYITPVFQSLTGKIGFFW